MDVSTSAWCHSPQFSSGFPVVSSRTPYDFGLRFSKRWFYLHTLVLDFFCWYTGKLLSQKFCTYYTVYTYSMVTLLVWMGFDLNVVFLMFTCLTSV